MRGRRRPELRSKQKQLETRAAGPGSAKRLRPHPKASRGTLLNSETEAMAANDLKSDSRGIGSLARDPICILRDTFEAMRRSFCCAEQSRQEAPGRAEGNGRGAV